MTALVPQWDEIPEIVKRPDIFVLDVRSPEELVTSGKIVQE